MTAPGVPQTHYNPVRILAGTGQFARVGDHLPKCARALIVTTAGATARGLTKRLQASLGDAAGLVHDGVTPNPELDDLDALVARYRGEGLTHIVGFGGGSALDAAKSLAAALAVDGPAPLHDVLRGGKTQDWTGALPVIAIPTTAGTGSEVTPFATVWDSAAGKKHSVTGPQVFPAVALLDPELTLSLPQDQTLFTGLDAISHALESLWNKNRSPISAAHAVHALALAAEALPAVLARPSDLEMRSRMQYAGTLAGLAIARTRTAIAHSISYPVTLHFGVPHGLACSFTLKHLLQINLDKIPALPHERAVLQSILALLDSLALGERIRAYATARDIASLEGEMYTPGRADNFTGTMGGGIADLVAHSVG